MNLNGGSWKSVSASTSTWEHEGSEQLAAKSDCSAEGGGGSWKETQQGAEEEGGAGRGGGDGDILTGRGRWRQSCHCLNLNCFLSSGEPLM